MRLTKQIFEIILAMRPAFTQARIFHKFIGMLFGVLCVAGRHTITSLITFLEAEFGDWTSFYRFFSKSQWDEELCQNVILKTALKKALEKNNDHILISIDDFRVQKTGKTIPYTSYQKDPKSPGFHLNLVLAHRYLHVTLVICQKKKGKWGAARSIPIRIELAPHVKKPGKKATDEDRKVYNQEKKEKNLCKYAQILILHLRTICNQLGYSNKTIYVVADGSYCNKTIFRNIPKNVEIISRCRKDAKLCFRTEKNRKFYSKDTFTPHEIYKDETVATIRGNFYYGRKTCLLKFKEVLRVFWQTGAQKRPLRSLIVYGIKYRRKRSGYTNYREPMYLLSTDLTTKAKTLIQYYIYRWEIEVVHRELKNNLGLADAQVWNEKSIHRWGKTIALAHGIAHLSAIFIEPEEETPNYLKSPKWYRKKTRVSLEDIRRRVRKEAIESGFFKEILGLDVTWRSLFEKIAV